MTANLRFSETHPGSNLAACPDCVADTLDPFSRWYRYPFTSCRHCGPRFSFSKGESSDRQHSSMANFSLCAECCKVYDDPSDRRYQSPTLACHICGPKAWLERADGRAIVADMFSMMDDVDAACTLIQRGEIVAIKGMGGFHLTCDATNETAVQKLRLRKQSRHPFALMARDVDIIRQFCTISEKELELLNSAIAPIVILPKNTYADDAIAPSVTLNLATLGFMLPAMPLHHLMLRRMKRPIVITSGNLAGQPVCIDNDEAKQTLGAIADFFLLHNLPIARSTEDSIVPLV